MSSDAFVALRPEDLRRADRVLEAVVSEADARCALLLDRRGILLTAVGDTAGLDTTRFAALAAADLHVSGQLADLVGEQEFTDVCHHVANGSTYLSGIAGVAILAAVFDRRTTIGALRLGIGELVPVLRSLLVELDSRMAFESRLEPGWADHAAHEVDRLMAG